MKMIVLSGIMLFAQLLFATEQKFDISGNYNCVDITLNSSSNSVKMTHETSLKSMSITQNEQDDYSIKIGKGSLNILQVIATGESVLIKSIIVGSLKEMGTTYDKVEMTIFQDVENKVKALLQGLTVVVPRIDKSSPQAYEFAVECTKE